MNNIDYLRARLDCAPDLDEVEDGLHSIAKFGQLDFLELVLMYCIEKSYDI